MSHHQHELRLAVSSAAEALISDLGGEAYAVARRRAGRGKQRFPREGLERSRSPGRTQNGKAIVVARLDASLVGGIARGRPSGRPSVYPRFAHPYDLLLTDQRAAPIWA